MDLVLPPGMTPTAFGKVLDDFAGVVGKEWVLASDEDRFTYLDPYAPGDGSAHAPSAAVAPRSAEEVQAILRIANAHKLPLWPVSRGKNLGYGGAAPVVPGSVVLDLGRMKRIVEVDEKAAYAVIEPGVGFFDLYRHLAEHKIPLFMSIPGNSWGSVIGNALERGIGYTPYGDNSAKLCGLEVVLPTGELVRTGMGAMANSAIWRNCQFGFGPHWDQLLVQSNFGVVTQAGIWLMPEPEATLAATINLAHLEDIGWLVDAMARLRLDGVVQQPLLCGSYLHTAALLSQRDSWFKGKGAIPDNVAKAIMAHFGTGWWTAIITLYGYEKAIRAHADIVRRALEPRLRDRLRFGGWRRGEPIEGSGAGLPDLLALRLADWHGGRGGHVDFSPVLPADGKLAVAQAQKMKKRFDEFGLDYCASFTVGERHVGNINSIVFDRDDADMVKAARSLFETVVADAAQDGYGVYRAPISFMQLVADRFDFNGHALRGLAETVKDALDPNGVLAPGKNGIWPRPYRERGQ